MSARFLLLLLIIPSAVLADDTGTPPLSFSECYRLALARSEIIAMDAEAIAQSRARFIQALGTALPQVSFSVLETRQESSTQSVSTGTSTTGFFGGSTRVSTRNFVFTQTLFSGFREFAAMAGSRKETAQRAQELERARQLLYSDVADAFYLLIEQRQDLRILCESRKALEDRAAEIRRREQIGRSRPSEEASTLAQLYAVDADIESARTQEAVARDLLEYLIGRPVGELVDYPDGTRLAGTREDYLKKARSRADVRAARLAWEAAGKSVAVARAGLMPTVSVEGDLFTRRTSLPGSNWSGLFRIDVPIFEGTTVYGQIMEARSRQRVAELQLSQVERIAEQNVKDAYSRVDLSLRREESLRKAYIASERNFTLQAQDYESSLVSNLDVLSALLTLSDSRRSYTFALYESKRLFIQLQVAAGESGSGGKP